MFTKIQLTMALSVCPPTLEHCAHGTHPRHTPTRTDKTTHRKETNEKFSSPSDDANGDWAGQNDTDVLFWALEPLSVARPSPQRHWPRQSRPTRRRPCPSSNHLQKIQIPFQPFLSYFSNDNGALSSASCICECPLLQLTNKCMSPIIIGVALEQVLLDLCQ